MVEARCRRLGRDIILIRSIVPTGEVSRGDMRSIRWCTDGRRTGGSTIPRTAVAAAVIDRWTEKGIVVGRVVVPRLEVRAGRPALDANARSGLKGGGALLLLLLLLVGGGATRATAAAGQGHLGVAI